MTIKFNKLTRANQRQLAPGSKLSEHGIDFERLSNGDGRYTINVMVDGQRIHRVVGKESEGVTRLQAEELISKLRADARYGRLNLPKGRKIICSFKEAGEQYLKRQVTEGAKNLKPKHNQLKRYLMPYFNDSPLNQLTSSRIEEYKKSRQQSGAKPGTINRELATLSHLFSMAIEWKWLESKPGLIKRFKEDQTRITYLTVEQAERLLVAAKEDQNRQVYLFGSSAESVGKRRLFKAAKLMI